MKPIDIADDLRPLIDHINRVNGSNLVLTVADNEVLVEEHDVPLVIIENVHDSIEAHTAVYKSLHLWGLTV
jgi:hypothetical protein